MFPATQNTRKTNSSLPVRQSVAGSSSQGRDTQILAISQGVPISVANSTYAKGPFTNMSNSSSKYSRLQNSVPRTYQGHESDQNSVSRAR